eukprot:3485170-Prymnesium_polylepis.1
MSAGSCVLGPRATRHCPSHAVADGRGRFSWPWPGTGFVACALAFRVSRVRPVRVLINQRYYTMYVTTCTRITVVK